MGEGETRIGDVGEVERGREEQDLGDPHATTRDGSTALLGIEVDPSADDGMAAHLTKRRTEVLLQDGSLTGSDRRIVQVDVPLDPTALDEGADGG